MIRFALTAKSINYFDAKVKHVDSMADFKSIKVSGFPGKILIHPGCEKNSIAISAKEDVLDKIDIKIRDEILLISIFGNISTSFSMVIDLKVKNIESLFIEGAAKVIAENIINDQLSVKIGGASSFAATGSVNKLMAAVSGNAELQLKKTVVKQCDVQVNGAGEAVLHVTELLKADITEAGEVSYYGNPPQVFKNIRGAGKIVPVHD